MSHLFALINCGTQCEDSALLILLSTACEDLECRKALEDKGRAFESTLLQALLLIFLSNMKNILLSPTRCFFFSTTAAPAALFLSDHYNIFLYLQYYVSISSTFFSYCSQPSD